MITADLLKKVSRGKVKEDVAEQLATSMNEAFPVYDVTTARRQAHFIGQVCIESQYFTKLEENLNYTTPGRLRQVFGKKRFPTLESEKPYLGNPKKIANFVYANRMGNGPPSSGDGWKYRGRSWMMLTGKENYEKTGERIGLDLVNNPDLAADPANGILIALDYWDSRKLNALADQDKGKEITFKINGGYNHLTERLQVVEACKRILRLSEPVNEEPEEPESTSAPEVDPDPYITPSSDVAVIKVMQQLLNDKNYSAGRVDGDWTQNGLTDAAVAMLQKHNNLPIQDAIKLSEIRAAPKWVIEERQNATISDLREEGSETVKNADIVQVAGGTAVAAGAAEKVGFFDMIGGWFNKAGTVKGWLEPFGDIGQFILDNYVVLGLIGLGGLGFWFAQRTKQKRLREFKEAKTQ